MKERIARYLDAAVLRPEMTREEAERELRESIALGVRAVCVRPCDIPLAKRLAAGTETEVCVVLGFPHGDQLSESKADEARRYAALGVAEIDMVANYGHIRSGLWQEVEEEIAAVRAITRPAGILLKVILETAQLDPNQIRRATEAAARAGADFVKTSTGFGGAGAKREDVLAMVEAAAGRAQVKASGGIRDRASAEEFLAIGATRLGVGSGACPAICAGDAGPSAQPSGEY